MNTRFSLPNRALALVKYAQHALIFVATVAIAGPALAGPGHDHGNDAPAAASAAASPRVSGHSDLFELVGIVDNGVMTIYLDRYASNVPVVGATIEVEASAAKGLAAPQADGTYRFEHAVLRQTGTLPVSFTVGDGKDTDLLAGDLNLAAAHAEGHHDHGTAGLPWARWVAYAAALLGLLLLTPLALRQIRRSRSQQGAQS